MRMSLILLLPLTLGMNAASCGGGDEPTPTPEVSPTPEGTLVVDGGNVSGQWCGAVQINGAVTVPTGSSLAVCAGSILTFGPGIGLQVEGSLALNGSLEQPVVVLPQSAAWGGLKVVGSLHGSSVNISGGGICVEGLAASSIDLVDARIEGCQYALKVSNGARVARSQLLGGGTVFVKGGMLELEDTTLDLGHDGQSPDCIDLNGGGVDLRYSHISGCHCPLHILKGDLGVSVTSSVLEGAAIPVMISNAQATFRGNNVQAGQNQLMDIGGQIQADVAGNYWGGGAPSILSANPSQFSGTSDFATQPFSDAGPRL